MSEQPSLKAIGKINGAFLQAMTGLGGAWIFWGLTGPGFEVFTAFAAIFAIGGVIALCKAVYLLIRAIDKCITWGGFKSKGKDPKADPVASEDDLRKKGLTQ